MLGTTPHSIERAETKYSHRAVYEIPENVFTTKRSPVPTHMFVNERDKAFSKSTPSGLIDLDLSDQFPARW